MGSALIFARSRPRAMEGRGRISGPGVGKPGINSQEEDTGKSVFSIPRNDVEKHGFEAAQSMPPRKSSKYSGREPYRKPTQVGGMSNPRRSRELWPRNSAKSPRNFGRRGAPYGERTCSSQPKGAAVKWWWRLFTKNIGLCEVARRRIRTDACPVPEG